MKLAGGPFEILEILGEGSFGTVCVARVTGDPLRRKVALKILKSPYTRNQKILNRTRDEARLLSRINHPNVVRVERLMDVGGRPVIVMEHVQGVSLDQLLLRFKDGLPASIAIEVMRHTCLALHVAFNEATGDDGRALRVIHRDIKPSNILLSIHGEAKVVDFGIAKGDFEGREAETQSVVMGSRPYMAPERLDGISDSPSVDVYSSGMSLFELLTGRTMSLSINPVTHDQAMNRQLAYLQVPGMPAEALEQLRSVIRRMCSYDREQRPSAFDAAHALEAVVYAIDPVQRLTLEDFAKSTVLPIYESRPKITPDDAAAYSASDDEFLREVTGQLTGTSNSKPGLAMSWRPYVFLGGAAAVVLALFVAVLIRELKNGISEAEASGDPTKIEAPAAADGKIEVKFLLFPDDAEITIDGAKRRGSGLGRLLPGKSTFEVVFGDGTQVRCPVTANPGTAVRYVGDTKISVDDAPAAACEPMAPAEHPSPPPG